MHVEKLTICKLTSSFVSFTICQKCHGVIEGDATPTSLQYQNVHWAIFSFSRRFCWRRKHISQSVAATVPLKTRINLRFDIFSFCIFLLKNQRYFFKSKHWKVFHYTHFSKNYKSLKITNLSKFLKKITVNETSKSYYRSPITFSNIELFHIYFSEIGCVLERPDIKRHLWLPAFLTSSKYLQIDLHQT